MASGSEEEITEEIQRALNELGPTATRLAPGMDAFETVDRGAKTRSADGRIEKAPDLVIRPIVAVPGVRSRTDWGWFVECKIIAATRFTPQLYCNHGVARFIRGEYAPRMPSALLIAYARDGRQPHATLQPLMQPLQLRRHAAGPTPDTSVSVHDRSGLPAPCVDITLTHLWLT